MAWAVFVTAAVPWVQEIEEEVSHYILPSRPDAYFSPLFYETQSKEIGNDKENKAKKSSS